MFGLALGIDDVAIISKVVILNERTIRKYHRECQLLMEAMYGSSTCPSNTKEWFLTTVESTTGISWDSTDLIKYTFFPSAKSEAFPVIVNLFSCPTTVHDIRFATAITSTAIRMLFFLMFFILLKTFVYRSVGPFVCVCIIHNKGVK